jgi:hypothetical protein
MLWSDVGTALIAVNGGIALQGRQVRVLRCFMIEIKRVTEGKRSRTMTEPDSTGSRQAPQMPRN